MLTNQQLAQRMATLQQKYPSLITVRDIGDSYEKTVGKADRDIWAITLTNSAIAGPKPVVEHVMGLHPRETAPPRLALDWIERTLAAYGSDPNATKMLDSVEIDVIPMANPDGNAVVERGLQTGDSRLALQRTNTHPDFEHGVDLNRNFDASFAESNSGWDRRQQTSTGPHAESEPETQALVAYTKTRKPNLYVDWHGNAALNMFPPGYTDTADAAAATSRRVATEFGALNGYRVLQISQIYPGNPVHGSGVDWVFDKVRSAAVAVEVGGEYMQPHDDDLREIERENFPVLDHAALVAVQIAQSQTP